MYENKNHLITGSELAIKNWPWLCQNVMANNEAKLWVKEWTDKLYVVKAHYENGGTVFTRP